MQKGRSDTATWGLSMSVKCFVMMLGATAHACDSVTASACDRISQGTDQKASSNRGVPAMLGLVTLRPWTLCLVIL